MTVFDDDVDMWEQAWADRLLQGESVDGERGLSDLISVVRASAEVPAPAPSAALAALLRDGLPTADVPAQRHLPEQVRYWGSRTFRAGLAGVAASLAMGAGVATAAAGGSTGPLSYVPEPVKRGVDAAVTAVADVLRPEPEAPVAPQPVQAPATSQTGGGSSDGPVSVKAPATTGSEPVSATPDATAPTDAPVKPVPTLAPEPTDAAPSLPPSALPTPAASETPEPGPSKSPEGEGRKPLDTNGSGSPSPSPTSEPTAEPTQEPTQQPSEAPAEKAEQPAGEQAEGEGGPGEKKDKPNRAELTVERID